MKVTCSQKSLIQGLSIVGRASAPKSSIPILGNILIQTGNDGIQLSATNYNTSINCWIDATVDEPGGITVNAKLVYDFVNSLPPDDIELTLKERTKELSIRCNGYHATMNGLDAADFPVIPTLIEKRDNDDPEVVYMELNAAKLQTMIDRVSFAASRDDSRPTLTGVEVSFGRNRLGMAATDGYRLSVASDTTLVDSQLQDDITIIIPAKNLAELSRFSVGSDDDAPIGVLMSGNRNQIIFRVDGDPNASDNFRCVEMVSQLIDARFPDYRAIIPKMSTTFVRVNTEQLQKSVRISSLFAWTSGDVLRIAVMEADEQCDGGLRLTAVGSEIGESVSEISAVVGGPGLETAYSARFLSELLAQINEEELIIELTEGRRPGVIYPADVDKSEFIHVLMPMNPPR